MTEPRFPGPPANDRIRWYHQVAVTIILFQIIVLWLGMLWPGRRPVSAAFKPWLEVITVGQQWSIPAQQWIEQKVSPRPKAEKPLPRTRGAGKAQSAADQRAIFWRRLLAYAIHGVAIAIVIPVLILRVAGWKLRDLGLGLPNRLGWRIIGVGYLVALPLVAVMSWNAEFVKYYKLAFRDFWLALGATAYILVPEHVSFHGWALALLLPTRKFPEVSLAPAPAEAGRIRRALMWLGLGQPAVAPPAAPSEGVATVEPPPPIEQTPVVVAPMIGPVTLDYAPPGLPGEPRRWSPLAWLGIDGGILMAMVLSGVHFYLAHIGKPPVELLLSSIGGVGIAYVAVRSGSCWAAFILHVMTGLTALGIVQLAAMHAC